MLVGKKVRLRQLKKADIQLDYEYLCNLEIVFNKRLGIPYPMTLENERTWFQKQKDINDIYQFSIETIENELYIGSCGIDKLDLENSIAVIYIYIVNSNYLGKGYGTEAMNLLLEFVFYEINVNKVQLRVFSFNERAIKSYIKNGFFIEEKFTQRIYRNGEYYDEIIMTILRDHFINSHKR